jgi:hypothetical protein
MSLATRVVARLDRHGMMVSRVAAPGVLGVTNAFALLRLLLMSKRDKDVEIRPPAAAPWP